jgi:hypothetical protein
MMELDSGDKELLRRAMARVASANDTLQFLSDHFRDKYGLTPQNQITPDGHIITTGATQFSLDGTEAVPNEVR